MDSQCGRLRRVWLLAWFLSSGFMGKVTQPVPAVARREKQPVDASQSSSCFGKLFLCFTVGTAGTGCVTLERARLMASVPKLKPPHTTKP